MDPSCKKKLADQTSFLLANLTVTERFLAELTQRNIFDEDVVEEIRCERTTNGKIHKIIHHLKRRTCFDLQSFLQILQDTNQQHVADELRRCFEQHRPACRTRPPTRDQTSRPTTARFASHVNVDEGPERMTRTRLGFQPRDECDLCQERKRAHRKAIQELDSMAEECDSYRTIIKVLTAIVDNRAAEAAGYKGDQLDQDNRPPYEIEDEVLSERLEKVENERNQLQRDLEDIQAVLVDKEQELDRYKGLYEESKTQLRELKRELNLTGLENQETTLRHIDVLNEQARARDEHITKLSAEINKLEQSAETLELDLHATNIKLQRIRTNRDDAILNRAATIVNLNRQRQRQSTVPVQLPIVSINFGAGAAALVPAPTNLKHLQKRVKTPRPVMLQETPRIPHSVKFCVICRRQVNTDNELLESFCHFHYGPVLNGYYTCCGLEPDKHTGCFQFVHLYAAAPFKNGRQALTDGVATMTLSRDGSNDSGQRISFQNNNGSK